MEATMNEQLQAFKEQALGELAAVDSLDALKNLRRKDRCGKERPSGLRSERYFSLKKSEKA